MGTNTELIREALSAVQTELASLEPQFREVRDRMMQLRQAADALQSLLGEGPTVRVEGSRGANSRTARLNPVERAKLVAREAERTAMDSAMAARVAAAEAARLEAQFVDGASPLGSEPSSTSRVVELLRERGGKPMSRLEIQEAFDKRGWIDPGWSQPEAAIRMAIRRAAEREDVSEVEGGRYLKWSPPSRARKAVSRHSSR